MIHLPLALIFLFMLLKSSDLFIDQSVAIAKKLRLSPFIIGFTIIALGTSLPELISSTFATLSGHPQLGISNVIGSNLANLCLILGLLPLFFRFKLSQKDVHINIPLVLIATSLTVIVFYFNNFIISASIGGFMLLAFFTLLLLINNENHATKIEKTKNLNYFLFLLSLISLIISGKLFIDNLLLFSKQVGIEETLLGFFVTAIGTSLPEVITTFLALKKGNTELGIGNILGSNLFNFFFVLGFLSLITPLNLSFFALDLLLMVMATILVLFSALMGKRYEFSKKEGLLIFSIYIIFIFVQFV